MCLGCKGIIAQLITLSSFQTKCFEISENEKRSQDVKPLLEPMLFVPSYKTFAVTATCTLARCGYSLAIG